MSQFRKRNFKTSNVETLKFLLHNLTRRKCCVQNKKSLFIASTIITMLTSKNMKCQFKAKKFQTSNLKPLILSYKILFPKTNHQAFDYFHNNSNNNWNTGKSGLH